MLIKKGNINEKAARVEIGLEGSIIKEVLRSVLKEAESGKYIDYETLFGLVSDYLVESMKKWTKENGRGSKGFSHFFHTRKRRELSGSYVARGSVTRLLMNGRKMESGDMEELTRMADAITELVEEPHNAVGNGEEIFSIIEKRITELPLILEEGYRKSRISIDTCSLYESFRWTKYKLNGKTESYTAMVKSTPKPPVDEFGAIGQINTYKFIISPYDEKGVVERELVNLFEIPEYIGKDYKKTISVVVDEGLRILNEKIFSDEKIREEVKRKILESERKRRESDNENNGVNPENINFFDYDGLSIEASAEASAEQVEIDSKSRKLFAYMRRIRNDFPFAIVRDSVIEPLEIDGLVLKDEGKPVKATAYLVNLRIKQNFTPENTEKYVTEGWRYLKEDGFVRRLYKNMASVLGNLESIIGVKDGKPQSSMAYRVMKGTVFAYLIDMARKARRLDVEKEITDSLRMYRNGYLYKELSTVSAGSAVESVVSMHVNAFANSVYASDETGKHKKNELKELLKDEFAVSYEAIGEVIAEGQDVKTPFGLLFTDYISNILDGTAGSLSAIDKEVSRVLEILEAAALKEDGEKYISDAEKFLKDVNGNDLSPERKRERLSILGETLFINAYKRQIVIPFEKSEGEEGIGVTFRPSQETSLFTKAKGKVIPLIRYMEPTERIRKKRRGLPQSGKTLCCINVYGAGSESPHNVFTLFKRKDEPSPDDLNLMTGFSSDRPIRNGRTASDGVRDSLTALFHYYRYLVLVLLLDSYYRKSLFDETKSLECFVGETDATDALMRAAMKDLRFFFPYDTKGISFKTRKVRIKGKETVDFYTKLDVSLFNLLRSKNDFVYDVEENKVRYIIAPVYESMSALEVLDPKTGKTELSSPDGEHMIIFYTKIESRPAEGGGTERRIERGYVLTESGLKRGCLKIFENDGYDPEERVFIFKKTRAFTDKDFRAISEFLEGRGDEEEESRGFCGHCVLSDMESRHISGNFKNMVTTFGEKPVGKNKDFATKEVIVRYEGHGRKYVWSKAELWRTEGFHPESRFSNRHGIFRMSLVFKTHRDSKKYIDILDEIESREFDITDAFKGGSGENVREKVLNGVSEFLAGELLSATTGLTGKNNEDFSFSFFGELEESTTYMSGRSAPYITVHAETVPELPDIEYRISGIPILHDLLGGGTGR